MRKTTNLIRLGSLAIVMGLMSCEENLLDREHYEKIIYLKSNENNIFTYTHKMNDSVSTGFLTLGSGGTMPLDEDVRITLEVDTTILNSYNYRNYGLEYSKHVKLVDSNLYVLPSFQIILRKDEPAATTFFPIEIDANELSPDTTYMIPFRIVSASGYEVNPAKSFVLYQPQLANVYSSPASRFYKMKGSRQREGAGPSNITATKSIVPLASNRVRMFPENLASSTAWEDIRDKTIVLIINDDHSVRIKPFRNIQIDGADECYYDPELQTFNLSYRYKLPTQSDWVQVVEILTRVE